MIPLAMAAVAVISMAYVLLPLFRRETSRDRKPGLPDDGVAEKRALATAELEELEADYRLGRIAKEDYEELRAEVERRASP